MTSNRPLLSLGLMVFNGEDYLSEQIESLLNQTFDDFHLIIGDNASTDKTEQICRDFMARDRRIRYIRREQNVGATRNANLLFRESTGKYFKFVAHDDVHAPSYLERCIDVLESEPDFILCHTGTVLIDQHGKPLPRDPESGCYADWSGRLWPIDPPTRRLDSTRPHERYHDILHHTLLASEFWAVMRRDVLARTRLLGDYFGSDRPLLAALALIGRFHSLSDELFYLRRHPTHATSQSMRKRSQVVIPGAGSRRQISSALVYKDFGRAILEAETAWPDKLRCLKSWLGLAVSRRTLRKIFLPGRYNVFGIDFRTNNRDPAR